ncbi:MAG: hypothetical protein QOF84_5491 [Streptomyces sp.]|nr:hypothetical protein [Streptomyces sp.]
MEDAVVGPPGRERTTLRVAVPPRDAHPSHYVVRDLVVELTVQGAVPQAVAAGPAVGRVLAKARLRPPAWQRRRRGPVVVPMMGARFGELYAAALTGDVVPYCWDVWEPQWELWAGRLRPLRPPAVFVTAAQSAQFLTEALPQSQVFHLPEATRVSRYSSSRPLGARTIGVLELGRRHQKWHDAVGDALRSRSDRSHLYESRSGRLVYPDAPALCQGLSDAAISVCFPSSLTHPQRAGIVETMTHRYLESMASGCLILGQAPEELVRLMGFNPVVEVDWSAPAEQVLEILDAPQRWQRHVDRALRRLRETGDWSVRTRTLRAALRTIGLPEALPGSMSDSAAECSP